MLVVVRGEIVLVVSFDQLSQEVILKVVDKFLKELQDQLKEKKVELEATDKARAWLAEKGYEPAYGARPMSRTIQEHVKKPLAEELLYGKLSQGGKVKVDFDKEGLTFLFS
jgi:ATP-dependent Clp protease ATP-binding subunit ClpA